jgi:tRNA dimethylallyltransferase
LAAEIDGAEIISADSRQVFRGMDIGTAKATASERAVVPHHGLDLVDPDETFSAADYRAHAIAALRRIADAGGVALLTGGTGLYLRTIGRGLPLEQGGHDAELRAKLEQRRIDEGLPALAADLRQRDPEAADGLDLANPRRVVRALERLSLTGSASPPAPEGYGGPSMWLGLTYEPAAHRARITERIDQHFAAGLLDEASTLRHRYAEDLPAFSAMGYREAFDVLADRTDIEHAKTRDVQRTLAYAKRQSTWFRSEPGIEWLPEGEQATRTASKLVASFLGAIDDADYAGGR